MSVLRAGRSRITIRDVFVNARSFGRRGGIPRVDATAMMQPFRTDIADKGFLVVRIVAETNGNARIGLAIERIEG